MKSTLCEEGVVTNVISEGSVPFGHRKKVPPHFLKKNVKQAKKDQCCLHHMGHLGQGLTFHFKLGDIPFKHHPSVVYIHATYVFIYL